MCVVQGFTRFFLILLGFVKFGVFLIFFWVLLGFTRFY